VPAFLDSVIHMAGRGVAAGALLLALGSCGRGATDSTPPLPLTEVARVELLVDADSVLVGDSLMARTRTVNREGTPVEPQLTVWTSSDATTGSISGAGTIHGRNVGTVAVTVQASGVTATRTVRIVSRALSLRIVSPDTVTMADAVELRADVTTPAGVPLTEVAPRFRSTDSTVAAVAPLALGRARVTLRGPGQADLLAIVGRDTSRRRLTVRLAAVTTFRLVVEARVVSIGDSLPYTLVIQTGSGQDVPPGGAVFSVEPFGPILIRNGYVIGAGAGRAVVRASYGALTSRDTVTAQGPSEFRLDIVDGDPQNPLPGRVQQSMARVTQRWRSIIRAAPPGEFVRLSAGECRNRVGVAEFITGLRVLITLDSLAPRVAGQGGPCVVRATGLPLFGTISLNVRTWSQLTDRKLDDLIQHEVGHVLGIGTVWFFGDLATLLDGDSNAPDPIFSGPAALTAFTRLSNHTQFAGRPVPVQVRVRGHWRANAFGGELMSPTLITTPQVTSAVTVATLRDLGWTVELEAYDDYVLPDAALSAGAIAPRVLGSASLTGHLLDDDALLPQIVITRTGRQVRLGTAGGGRVMPR